MGGLVMTPGQRRSGKLTGLKGWYLRLGLQPDVNLSARLAGRRAGRLSMDRLDLWDIGQVGPQPLGSRKSGQVVPLSRSRRSGAESGDGGERKIGISC